MDDAWHQEHAWHVLRPDGSPLARVTLASNSRIAAVGDARVAVVVRDSLDVEHVQVLALPDTMQATPAASSESD